MRRKYFFTTVKGYADKYARTACKRVGGEPIVYEVLPLHPKLMVKVKGCDIYYDNEAIAYEKLKVGIFDNIVSQRKYKR